MWNWIIGLADRRFRFGCFRPLVPFRRAIPPGGRGRGGVLFIWLTVLITRPSARPPGPFRALRWFHCPPREGNSKQRQQGLRRGRERGRRVRRFRLQGVAIEFRRVARHRRCAGVHICMWRYRLQPPHPAEGLDIDGYSKMRKSTNASGCVLAGIRLKIEDAQPAAPIPCFGLSSRF